MSQELIKRAEIVRDEKVEGQNTAKRVGDWMVDAANDLHTLDKDRQFLNSQSNLFKDNYSDNLQKYLLPIVGIEQNSETGFDKIEIARIKNTETLVWSTYLEAIGYIGDQQHIIYCYIKKYNNDEISVGNVAYRYDTVINDIKYTYTFHFDFEDYKIDYTFNPPIEVNNNAIINNRKYVVDSLESDFLPKNSNLIPSNVLNSSYANSDIWINDSFLHRDGSLAEGNQWVVLKHPIQIEQSGTYRMRCVISGNARILVYNNDMSIKKSYSENDVIFANTWEIEAEKGDFINFSHNKNSTTVTAKNLYISNQKDILFKSDSALIKDINREISDLKNNLDTFNDKFSFSQKGDNLLKEPIWENLSHGYIYMSNGSFIDHVDYRTTALIKIPKGAKVYIELPSTIGLNAENTGVTLFENDSYLTGFNFNSPNYIFEDNKIKFTFENEFNDSDNLSIRICAYRTATFLDLKVVTFDNNIVFDNMSSSGLSSFLRIEDINKDTKLSIPHTIYDEAGNIKPNAIGQPNSKSVLHIPFSKYHNIRFRFRILDDLINSSKSAVVFKANSVEVNVTGKKARQWDGIIDDNGTERTVYQPFLETGLLLNGYTAHDDVRRLHGGYSFGIRYTGDVNKDISISNTGKRFIIKENNAQIASFDFDTFSLVSELYAELSKLNYLDMDFNSIEDKKCEDLVQFEDVRLTSYYKKGAVIRDAPRMHIPYAICNEWIEVEIVTLSNNTYLLCNGAITTIAGSPIFTENNVTDLEFGGNCNVLFKDIEIDTKTSRDAEIVNLHGTQIISEFNPLILMWEGHDIIPQPSHEVEVHTGNMGTTPDRLQLIFEMMRAKGYVSVSINDLMDYYQFNKPLPKRSFLMMFDDFRYDNYLNLKNRSPFTRYNVKPSLCTNTAKYKNPFELVLNGVDITPEKAYMVGKLCNFDNVTHTRDHRRITDKKYSEYEPEFILDIHDADRMNVQSNALVYPYGSYDAYAFNTMRWLGFNLGIRVVNGRANRRYTDPMAIARVEIGLRSPINNVKNIIV